MRGIGLPRYARDVNREPYPRGRSQHPIHLFLPMEVIYGIHAVEEALKARGRAFEYVGVARERKDARVQRIVESCRAAGVALRFLPRDQVERLAGKLNRAQAVNKNILVLAKQLKEGTLASGRKE